VLYISVLERKFLECYVPYVEGYPYTRDSVSSEMIRKEGKIYREEFVTLRKIYYGYGKKSYLWWGMTALWASSNFYTPFRLRIMSSRR
jgi:hypothetical protein